MIKLSGVVITFNEERNIERCLGSLANVVDEIVVVDSFSTDQTKALCAKFKVRFIEQEFLGYIEQKNFAVSKASYDHIVALDGDEALSEPLQESIKALKTNWTRDGYYANRFNFFCGQWIKHSDWYPNRKLRVFDRRVAEWQGLNPHDEVVLLNHSKPGKLKGDILHWTYQSYSEFRNKSDHFSTIASKAYFEQGLKAPLLKMIWNPFWAFFKAYFLRLGVLDGKNGFVISRETARVTYLKYQKLRNLYRS